MIISPNTLPAGDAHVWRSAFATAWANHEVEHPIPKTITGDARERYLEDRMSYAERVADAALRGYRLVCADRENQ